MSKHQSHVYNYNYYYYYNHFTAFIPQPG